MNIVFLVGRWGIGGVERVTRVLAEGFLKRGWGVGIIAFEVENDFLLKDIDSRIALQDLGGIEFSAERGRMLRRFISDGSYSVLVNQWCVPYAVTRFVRKWTRGMDLRLIAAHHNQVNTNKRIHDAKNPFVRMAITAVTSVNAALTYHSCDAYVVLCESFKPMFRRFTLMCRAPKLYAISDPLTITVYSSQEKTNDILYVGRLEETQKRVSRIIDIWRSLGLQNWQLNIVGDGPDMESYKKSAEGLGGILFHGFKDPRPFYAQGKILLLTSAFEGFGLVIVEAMAYGCVPIVLGSYPAVYDIIDDGKNGVILPMPFDVKSAGAIVNRLTKDEVWLTCLSQAARQKADSYSLDCILDKWEALIKGLL